MPLPEILTAAVVSLSLFYLLDRSMKAVLVTRFFRDDVLVEPPNGWPIVALIQPVTQGATNLAENMRARGALNYPGEIRHIVVCDTRDEESQRICRAALPGLALVRIAPDMPSSPIATKVAKMAAGLESMLCWTGLPFADVVCFVDDDIGLPPDALQHLVAPLYAPTPAGATFGLACQTSWNTIWESLMSGFVNANALTGYVPLTFFVPPFTITGHVFALRWTVFAQAGGMTKMEHRFDDDHEIARRVRALGLPLVQTPLIYSVANALSSFAAYRTQLRRWFVMPKQAMAPYLTRREQTVSLLLGLGNLFPTLVFLGAILLPNPITLLCTGLTFLVFLASYLGLELCFLPFRTPWKRRLLLPIIAFVTPLHVLLALLLPGDRITWRGQSYRAKRDGTLERPEE